VQEKLNKNITLQLISRICGFLICKNILQPSTSSPNLPSWCTGCSTAVHHLTLARSLTLPTFQVAKDFALPAVTASPSLRFTAALLAAEHFQLLAPKCGTACHRRLRWHRLWQPSALDSRRCCLRNHILTFG